MLGDPFPTSAKSIDQLLQEIESDCSFEKPGSSYKTIQQLVEEGYVGVDYGLSHRTGTVSVAHQFKQIHWVKTIPDATGSIGLMTNDLQQFDQFLSALQEQLNQAPTVYRSTSGSPSVAPASIRVQSHPSPNQPPNQTPPSHQSASSASAQPAATPSQPTSSSRSGRRDIAEIAKGYQLDGKYEVVDRLGEGGFGATFIVKSLTSRIDTYFVAKCQKLTEDSQHNADLIECFEKEAFILQKVGSHHGQIPALFDYFDFEGNFYLIQELIRGKTLDDTVRGLIQQDHVFSEQKAAKITVSLLEILEHLHQQGLIHRDIKPQNIILREGDFKPVLIDFGLIKQATQDNYLRTGTRAGTMGYAPIEQMVMGKALFQSDLYAVGMTMLFMTTGCPPTKLEFNQELEADLSWLEEECSPLLFDWLQRAIRPLPQDRFASASEMRQELLEYLNQEYLVRGVQYAEEAYQQQIASMQQELDKLRVELSQQTAAKPASPGQGSPAQPIAINAAQVITTQKEIDAFNIVKRLIEQAGYDPNLLQLTDAEQHCDIHLRQRPDCVLVRLFFNDENNLAFAIPLPSGKTTPHLINTLRGISPKKDQIIARMIHLLKRS